MGGTKEEIAALEPWVVEIALELKKIRELFESGEATISVWQEDD